MGQVPWKQPKRGRLLLNDRSRRNNSLRSGLFYHCQKQKVAAMVMVSAPADAPAKSLRRAISQHSDQSALLRQA